MLQRKDNRLHQQPALARQGARHEEDAHQVRPGTEARLRQVGARLVSEAVVQEVQEALACISTANRAWFSKRLGLLYQTIYVCDIPWYEVAIAT